MLDKIFSFKHESDNIPAALGLTEELDNKCREIVNFASFSNYFIKKNLFDEQDESPSNLTTVTGILQKALSLCQTEEERAYTLFVFRNVHDHASGALGAYEAYSDDSDDKSKAKMKAILELMELKVLSEEDERSNYITPKDMFKKIEAAKDNMYNFEKYYSVVNESKN